MSSDREPTIPLLDLREQYRRIQSEVDEAVARVMWRQEFVTGVEAESLESELCEFLNVPHAVGVSSGTDALMAALMALEIGPGDEVVTTAFSFFSTAGAIHRLGGRPVFADIEADTLNLDPACVERVLSPRTKAILAVHLYGQCCDMGALRQLAEPRGIKVIEDAAQALGARQHDVAAGALGDVACFSFHPSKNLGAAGDAGLVTTTDDALADRLRLIRQHGARPKYHHRVVGGNFRLDELQAAVLRAKLPHLNAWNRTRRQSAARYDALLDGSSLRTPVVRAENECVFQQYTVQLDEGAQLDEGTRRDEVRERLLSRGVSTGVYYPLPLHLQPCFAALGYCSGDLPETEAAAARVLSLPIFPEISDAQLGTVARELRAALTG